MAAIGWPRRRPFGPGWLGELFAFHADRLGPTRPTKGEIVSDRFSYASGPDPRWTQLAEKVHAVVWDRIGVENIRDIIRQWAADFNRRHREAEQTRSDAAKKAETLIESVRKRTEIVLEVAEHWGDSVDISEAACFRMCDNVVPPLSGRDWPPVPEDPRLPLPPPQGDTSAAEKWAALSAIHDTFWFGETINPWPVPHDYYVAPLPTDGDAIARRKQFLEGDCYWKLIEEAKQLSADEYRPFLERSLKELVAKPDDGEGNGGDGSGLGERSLLVLKVLLNGKAFDSDHRMRTADIAKRAAGKTADPNQYKKVVADLKGRGYVDTKEGRTGGCWLTAAGRSRAEKL